MQPGQSARERKCVTQSVTFLPAGRNAREERYLCAAEYPQRYIEVEKKGRKEKGKKNGEGGGKSNSFTEHTTRRATVL